TVEGQMAGDKAKLAKPGNVKVQTKVAFASTIPLGTAKGGSVPPGKTRKVEVIVNGKAVASKDVPADDQAHDLTFDIPIERSSWVALRQFPQMHTNPVEVIVNGAPIRASRKSCQWCVDVIEQLWRVRNGVIAPNEREEAQRTFQAAIERYKK